MKTNLLPLAKEGISYFFCSVSVLVVSLIFSFDFLAFLSLVSSIFIGYSFRNPERNLCVFEAASFLSPVDGIVESIEELHNHRYSYKIEIQSSYKDVGILRAPANATVTAVSKHNGTRVSSNSKLFTTLNENTEISFITEDENKFSLTHRLKQSFAPLFLELHDTQKLIQSTRYGLILNGRTSIYLPHNFRISTSIGSELKASESLMGYFS